jgi:hypothetical protein
MYLFLSANVSRPISLKSSSTNSGLSMGNGATSPSSLVLNWVPYFFAASTQNQPIDDLVFIYKRLLESTFENLKVTCSPKEERVPVVFARE